MRVLFVSSEVYPFSKTGGLADVAGALPQTLARLGHEVLVVSPWYKTLKAATPLWIGDVEVPFDGGMSPCGVGAFEQNGVRYAFVGHGDFQRDQIYGYDDDVKRFARFSRAVPQVAARVGFMPDVIHVNDWHSAYLPMILMHGWHLPEGFPGLPSVFTVHNVQYQGVSGLDETLHWLRLPGELRDGAMNHFGSANAMQAGLSFANQVTTVSPGYAAEIQTPAYGYGLDGTLRHIAPKLTGILNGLDTDTWNPATDPHVVSTYTHDAPDLKSDNKTALEREFGLEPGRPLMGVVSRLVEQKGIDLVLGAAEKLLIQGWNLCLLGAGEAWMEDAIGRLTAANPGRVGSFIGYDEALAHRVYAGSDTLVVPSRFEPCGLTQMIAMRYGSLPVVRATGGLKDTVRHRETGFLFEHASADGLLRASWEAFKQARHVSQWRKMIVDAMREDFSWERSARTYLSIYRKAGQEPS